MTRPSDAWARSARLAPTFRALVPMATGSQSIGRPRLPRDIERGAERGTANRWRTCGLFPLGPRVVDRQPVKPRGALHFYAAPQRCGSSSST